MICETGMEGAMADYSEEDPVLRNRIIADEGEYGTVDVSTDFGDASAGSEIYIRHYAEWVALITT